MAFSQWIRPRISRHAFIEIVPEGERLIVFGVHLSAVLAAWTEQRRTLEFRALMRSVAYHEDRFHVLAGDFNTIAPGDTFEVIRLPLYLRQLIWLSGGRVRWRAIQTVLDAGYADTFRMLHPEDPGLHPADQKSRRSGSTTCSCRSRTRPRARVRRGQASRRRRRLGSLSRDGRLTVRRACLAVARESGRRREHP